MDGSPLPYLQTFINAAIAVALSLPVQEEQEIADVVPV